MTSEITKKLNCKDVFNCVRTGLAAILLFALIFTSIFYQTEILEIVDSVPVIGTLGLFVVLFLATVTIMVLLMGTDFCKDRGCPFAYRGRRTKKPNSVD